MSRRKCGSRLRWKASCVYARVMFHLVTAQTHPDAITTHGGFVISIMWKEHSTDCNADWEIKSEVNEEHGLGLQQFINLPSVKHPFSAVCFDCDDLASSWWWACVSACAHGWESGESPEKRPKNKMESVWLHFWLHSPFLTVCLTPFLMLNSKINTEKVNSLEEKNMLPCLGLHLL